MAIKIAVPKNQACQPKNLWKTHSQLFTRAKLVNMPETTKCVGFGTENVLGQINCFKIRDSL